MVSNKRKIAVGNAIASLVDDVKQLALSLVQQYRAAPLAYQPSLMRQAVDTPARARAQLQGWMTRYDSTRSAGEAQALLVECLALVGPDTLAQINAALAALEAQALVLVGHVTNDGWTWDQVATAIESAIGWESIDDLSFDVLPIPSNYITVWGTPH